MKSVLKKLLVLSLAVLMLFPQTAFAAEKKETEPNDNKETATPLPFGTWMNGTMKSIMDYDWYSFTVSKAGTVKLNFKLAYKTDYYVFYLKDDSGSINSIFYEYMDEDDPASFVSKRIGLAPGKYYIWVESLEGSNLPEGGYKLKVDYTAATGWESEYNGSVATADPIKVGTTYNGSISSTPDLDDYYKLTLSTAQNLAITFKHPTSEQYQYWYVDVRDSTKDHNILFYQYFRNDDPATNITDKISLKKGTYYISVHGTQNTEYSFAVKKFVKPSLSKAILIGVYDARYTGKAIRPTPVVKLNGKTLKAGTDYTVSYKNNVKVGTATVTVTGKGDYTGAASETFRITDPVSEFVSRLYRVCLDRNPENQGLNWWVNRLKSKQETGGSCALGFFNSTEFKNHKYSNSAFLDHAYQAFFDRKPDTAGKKYWLAEMKKGMTRTSVIKGFAASNEWKALCKSYGIRP